MRITQPRVLMTPPLGAVLPTLAVPCREERLEHCYRVPVSDAKTTMLSR
jgi:hypothetical protein